MDTLAVRNCVNWTLPRVERQFSMLYRACTWLSSKKGRGWKTEDEKRNPGWMR